MAIRRKQQYETQEDASAEQATRIIGVPVLLLLCYAAHSLTPRASPRADRIRW